MSDAPAYDLVPEPEEHAAPGHIPMRVEFFTDVRDNKPRVRYYIPGDKFSRPVFHVNEQHKIDHPREWNAFVRQEDQMQGQTNLDLVGWLDEATRSDLRHNQVFSLEQLAGASDAACEQIGPGAYRLRERAQGEVERMKKAEGFDAQQAEIDDLKAQVAKLTAAQAAPKRGPGRPPKTAQAEAAA